MAKRGMSDSMIARKLRIDRRTVRRYRLSSRVQPRPARPLHQRRKKIITPGLIRAAQNAIKYKKIRYAKDLHSHLSLSCSMTTTRRLMLEAGGRWMKQRRKPQLRPIHKEARMKYAKDCITTNPKIYRTVFVDEKRFGMDAPASMLGCRQISKSCPFVPQSERYRESVMVFGGIGFDYKSDLFLINGTLSQKDYWELLNNGLIQSAQRKYGDDWWLAQDNAPCHVGKANLERMKSAKIRLTDWPPRSPDLNPIENLWGILTHNIYRHQSSFSTRAELECVLKREWKAIHISTINTLIDSIKDRSIEVLMQHGGETHY